MNASAHRDRTRIVALVGNPNTGKTTLFNALTGFRRKVANYPGVTVDVGRGPIRGTRQPMELLDLPGTYSLAAVSPDEMLVCDALCCRVDDGRCPDVVLAIADASNLPRNLYLISQLLDLGRPLVVALNMVDIARARGMGVDANELAARLGVPVVPVVATDPRTVRPLAAALEAALDGPASQQRVPLAEPLVAEATWLGEQGTEVQFIEGVHALLHPGGFAEQHHLAGGGDRAALEAARQRLQAAGLASPAVEVRARYAWIGRIVDGVVTRRPGPLTTWSDRIDRVLTHRVGGVVFLLAVLYVVFQSILYWSGPLMHAIGTGLGWLGVVVGEALPEGVLRSLVVDGVIAGVGGVLVFLPQIMILFAFLAILEDCGYMARAAFMVDRIMRVMGLSGRAFIPLLSSFACAVPAIMGARAIADRRERFVTILVIPFLSCSARLPIYLVMVGALVPDPRYWGGLVRVPALVMLSMYLLGVVVAIPVALVLKRTAFAGPSPGFLLELPGYKLPRWRTVWQRVWLSGRDFIVRAGTIILLVNLAVWALAYFPHSAATRARVAQQQQAAGWDDAQFQAQLAGEHLRDSYLGRLGHGLEPVIAPLGWDWRVGVSVIASFPAREVVIATLGTIFNLGEEAHHGSEQLREEIQQATWEDSDRPLFTLPVALSIMVFYALCAQCAGTLVVMGREMGSFLWPVLSFAVMTSLAYLAAWATGATARALMAHWAG